MTIPLKFLSAIHKMSLLRSRFHFDGTKAVKEVLLVEGARR